MSDPTDLVAWLSACYDRAEQRARAATPGPWKVARANDGSAIVDDAQDLHVIPPDIDYGPCVDLADCEHIADHDPQWRLDDIARKRKRLNRHQPIARFSGEVICKACSVEGYGVIVYWPCIEVRTDAEEFDGEPGYDAQRWTPGCAVSASTNERM